VGRGVSKTFEMAKAVGAKIALLPAWLFVLVAVGGALFASRAIISFQKAADEKHEAGKIVVALDSIIHGEQARNSVVIARGGITEAELTTFEDFRPDVENLREQLSDKQPGDPTVAEFRERSASYWQAVNGLVALVLAGRVDEARAGAPEAAALHDARAAVVTEAIARFSNEAESAETKATVATLLINISGALGLGGLFVFAWHQRNTASLPTCEAV
jgi:hypothetical protein